MTCTADPDYIRAVSVRYRRCPSSYSVRSAAAVPSGGRHQLLPTQQRPKTAVVSSTTTPAAPQRSVAVVSLEKEKTQLLEELMFFYGRKVDDSFWLPLTKHSSLERSSMTRQGGDRETGGSTFLTDSISLDHGPARQVSSSSAWSCQNEALRQMFKASERRPRHRFFRSATVQLPTVCAKPAP